MQQLHILIIRCEMLNMNIGSWVCLQTSADATVANADEYIIYSHVNITFIDLNLQISADATVAYASHRE
jgi:hypothetical protein